MNIRICEDPACADIEVVVRCRQLDDTVLSLLARLRVYDAKLTGERDGATYVLAAADVLYADTADKKTFLFWSPEGLLYSLAAFAVMSGITAALIWLIDRIAPVRFLLFGKLPFRNGVSVK